MIDLEVVAPDLAYVAPFLERYCAEGAEGIMRLLESAAPADQAQVSQLTYRLLDQRARDFLALCSYIEELRKRDPQRADTFDRFVTLIMPVIG